ncbi:MAG: MerR family transcriptional regulator [Nitratireductor sp.]
MNKSPDAFRTISEVAEDLDLPQHVLRFWETRFNQIKPLKRGGGRRYYRPEDVDLLKGIKKLLYDEGYTIRGLQRILKEQGNRFVVSVGSGEIEAGAEVAELPPTTAIGVVRSGEAGDQFEVELEAGTEAEAEDTPRGPGRKAVPVHEVMGGQEKSRGIFGRLISRENNLPPIEGGSELNAEDRRNLQATLYELLECKRLLDQVRGN